MSTETEAVILEVVAGNLRAGDVLGEGEVIERVGTCCGWTTAWVGLPTGGVWRGDSYTGKWENLERWRWRSFTPVRVARWRFEPHEVEV